LPHDNGRSHDDPVKSLSKVHGKFWPLDPPGDIWLDMLPSSGLVLPFMLEVLPKPYAAPDFLPLLLVLLVVGLLGGLGGWLLRSGWRGRSYGDLVRAFENEVLAATPGVPPTLAALMEEARREAPTVLKARDEKVVLVLRTVALRFPEWPTLWDAPGDSVEAFAVRPDDGEALLRSLGLMQRLKFL
jgi:hypothetical protein